MVDEFIQNKRIVLVYWKNKSNDKFEVFSNLKNFCLSYKQYNYNTINNYLSKAKIAYENQDVYIERKNVIMKPSIEIADRKIALVVRRVMLKDAKDEQGDLEYWLSRPVAERAAAITFIISQSLAKEQVMDKTKIVKGKM